VTTPTPEQAYAEAAVRRSQQLVEYGTYIATRTIQIGNAVAFNAGDPVPVGHVEKFGWLETGDVALRDTPIEGVDAQAVPSDSDGPPMTEDQARAVQSKTTARTSKPKEA